MKKLGFLILLAIVFLMGATAAAAPCQSHNVWGWGWSNMSQVAGGKEGMGWLSLSCTNNVAVGVGTDYGVDLSTSTSQFSGYAWSENIGWVDFAPLGPYPALPDYSACLDLPGLGQNCDGIGDYNAGGWARALAYGSGWDGWIKLRGTNYGVSVDGATGDFSGYAWSDNIIGWISFKGVSYKVSTNPFFAPPPPPPPPPPPGGNTPPDEPTAGDGGGGDEIIWSKCTLQEKSIPTFYWTYSDPDGDSQSAYEIEVDENASFIAPKFNNKVYVAATTTSYALNLADDDEDPDDLPASMLDYQLDWNTTYFWRVRVWDSHGATSTWSNSSQFKTDTHACPWVAFSWLPLEPTQGEIVEFDPDDSQTYGGTAVSSYLWTITQGMGNFIDGTSASSHYPKIIFSTADNKMKLQITDTDGFVCDAVGDVAVQLPLPEYKEIPPIIWFKKIFGGLVAFLDRF